MNLRAKQAQQTYEHILVTAEQLLKQSSYEELSVDQICECANISKGGFYHHFSSKDEFISLLIGRQMGNLIAERIEPCLKEKSAFELLEIYLNTTIEYLEKSPRSMLIRCWLALSEHPEITNSEFAKESFHVFHEIVEKGKAEGKICGAKEKQKEIAKKMKSKNMPIDEIIELTGLTKDEIERKMLNEKYQENSLYGAGSDSVPVFSPQCICGGTRRSHRWCSH